MLTPRFGVGELVQVNVPDMSPLSLRNMNSSLGIIIDIDTNPMHDESECMYRVLIGCEFHWLWECELISAVSVLV
jgi:hypothetical protein